MVYSPFRFYHASFFMKEKEYVLKSPVSLEIKSSANLWSIKEILLHLNVPGIEGSKSFCSIFWVFYS